MLGKFEKAYATAVVLLISLLVLLSLFVFLLFLLGYALGDDYEPLFLLNNTGTYGTFNIVEGGVCREGGRPVVRMYSTSTCPHCDWVGGAFDEAVSEYVGSDRIVARHWSIDEGDDLLTPAVEDEIPAQEMDVYIVFNPRRSVPTFVFGCKYYRVGTAYESQKNLTAEKQEFKAVIKELLSSETAST